MTRSPSLGAHLLLLFGTATACLASGTLTYPLLDNINWHSGTLECWVRLDFDPNAEISNEAYKSLAQLLTVKAETGHFGVFMYSGASFKGGYGWSCSIDGANRLLPFAAACQDWKQGEWHHVAVTWQDVMMRLYLDGEEVASRTQPGPVGVGLGAVRDDGLLIGDKWGKRSVFTLDEFRVSSIARQPEELGFHGELKPDPYTTILDRFEEDFVPDGKSATTPAVIVAGNGGVPTKGTGFVDGKFGKGLSFHPP